MMLTPKMVSKGLGALLIVLLLAGCGGAAAPVPATPTGAGVPTQAPEIEATPEAKPTMEAEPTVEEATPDTTSGQTLPVADENVVATLMTEGGMTGRGLPAVEILRDGTITQGGESLQLPGGPEVVEALESQLDETGIFAIPPGEYLPKDTCCDRFTYILTLNREGQSYSYTTMDATEEAPEALLQAIDAVRMIANEAGSAAADGAGTAEVVPTPADAVYTPSPEPTMSRATLPTPTPTPAVSAGLPVTGTEAPVAADAEVVTLLTEGGFTGNGAPPITLYGDGRVVVGDKTTELAGAGEAVTGLQQQLEATGIYDLPPGQYMPKNACCDFFTYTLTLNRGGQSYIYVTSDAHEAMPPALEAALRVVQSLALTQ